MKKWSLLILCLSLLMCLAGCGGKEPENIVGDLEGPEGIAFFGGLWYHEDQDLWIEIYYDGTWCSFEDGGMLRSFGDVTIDGQVGTLTPKEGEDRFILTATEDRLRDEEGKILFQVTEVGIRKPLIVNDRDVPIMLSGDEIVEGEIDWAFVKEYAGFYISEDGIFALEIFEDGTFEIQEYGLLIESGSFLRLTEPNYGEIFSVDRDLQKYRLVIPEEERLYLGECGIFAPGEKGTGAEE